MFDGANVGDDATVSFTETQNRADADLEILVDWDDDGDFSEPEENITTRVLALSTVTGRDNASQYRGRASPGEFRATVENEDGRFSQFNTESPLQNNGNSIGQGKLVRVQKVGAADTDPNLLASDRFESGTLTQDQTGKPWVETLHGGFIAQEPGYIVPRRKASPSDPMAVSVQTIDTGETDGNVVCVFDFIDMETQPGIVYRYADEDNYGFIRISRDVANSGAIEHWHRTAGVSTLQATGLIEHTEEQTITVTVEGTTISYGVGGEIINSETAYSGSGTKWGPYCMWDGKLKPRCKEFHVWDKPYQVNNDIIWTGRLTHIDPTGSPQELTTAEIQAEGPLAAAADARIDSYRTIGEGVNRSPATFTGPYVGDALVKSRLFHPPGPIGSTQLIGSRYKQDTSALDILREAESVEQGLLYETPEGPIGFRSKAFSNGPPLSAWTDTDPGGLKFEDMRLRDYRGDLVNQASAEVSNRIPRFYLGAAGSIDRTPGQPLNVDFDSSVLSPFVSSITAGDLFFYCSNISIASTDNEWVVPPGFKALQNPGTSPGQLAFYVKVLTQWDIDNLPTWLFLTDSTNAGGTRCFQWGLITEWYGALDGGVALEGRRIGEPTSGNAARAGVNEFPTLTPPGGVDPHVYFAILSAVRGASTGTTVQTPDSSTSPHRYYLNSENYEDDAVNDRDSALWFSIKNDVTGSETPSGYSAGILGFDFIDSVVVAVRGQETPKRVDEDLEAQQTLGSIKTWDYEEATFVADFDAQITNESLLGKYSRPRPSLTCMFTATKSQAHLREAEQRKVGDRIHITATQGPAKGVSEVFRIDAISNTWTSAGKVWKVEWLLSAG